MVLNRFVVCGWLKWLLGSFQFWSLTLSISFKTLIYLFENNIHYFQLYILTNKDKINRISLLINTRYKIGSLWHSERRHFTFIMCDVESKEVQFVENYYILILKWLLTGFPQNSDMNKLRNIGRRSVKLCDNPRFKLQIRITTISFHWKCETKFNMNVC